MQPVAQRMVIIASQEKGSGENTCVLGTWQIVGERKRSGTKVGYDLALAPPF